MRVAGDAPSVLFVHGACCQAIVWEPLMVALLDFGIASAAIGLRGHGGSHGAEHLQQYRIEHYVQDVVQTVPRLVQPVTLVGHSMGGLICQLAAADARPRRLILIASSPVKGMRADGMRMVRRHPWTFLAAFSRRSFLRLYRNPRVRRSLLYSAQTPEVVITSAADTLVEESWQAGNQMNTLLPDTTRVHCPAAVVGATDDFMVSRASVRATAAAYNVEPVFLPACGHMIQSEVPPLKLAALMHSLITV
jgi:pimeloyl-ACP methyl ester carboxylesterase